MPYATAIEVFQQLQMDADFLHGIGVMDYSLLGAYELLTIARWVLRCGMLCSGGPQHGVRGGAQSGLRSQPECGGAQA